MKAVNVLRKHLVITLILSVLQVFWVKYNKTDYVFELNSFFTYLEIIILISIFFKSKIKWTPFLILICLVLELAFFLMNYLPISPDYTLMMIIFFIRVFIIYKWITIKKQILNRKMGGLFKITLFYIQLF